MNVYVLNTLWIGLDTIDLVSKGVQIKGVIGLSDREQDDRVSGYVYQDEFCAKRGLEFIEVDTYNFSKAEDQQKILDLDIDVLLVSGWQRLVPDWFIQHCKMCVIGTHGSPLGITKGRGRSPQNWALIMGMESFNISIFEIDKHIDSGRILASKKFQYSDFDDIKTSYYKVCMLTSQMIVELLQNPNFMEADYEVQNEAEAEYFPQRMPEDGLLDWSRSNLQIRNFVRALTRPYPGAETTINGHSIKIWNVIPFDVAFDGNYQVGTIVKQFNNKDLVVKTNESFVLVDDYEVRTEGFELEAGMQFQSVSFTEQMDNIVQRHEGKYPDLPVSSMVKGFEQT